MEAKKNLLRELPPVDEILRLEAIQKSKETIPHWILVEKIREVISGMRQKILEGQIKSGAELNSQAVANQALSLARQFLQPNLRPVINATGVVLHTNLGRAALSVAAQQAIVKIAQGYSNLEIDLSSGSRGSRYSHVVELLCRLAGTEDALVVNNNAAAVLLALNTLAEGREVIVSRGQLVEIGGSFRVPEVMATSGARLVEVGTTNKTRLQDYRRAVTEATALLLKVHPSNYRVLGFTHETTLEELVSLGKETGLPVLEDLGSGFLVDFKAFGITGEPTVQEQAAKGADVITFSGDKLLGGTQAGILVGKKEYISRMAKNPLTRALRVDKLTMAALEVTLRAYLNPDQVREEIPTLRMLTMPVQEIEQKARNLTRRLKTLLGDRAVVKKAAGVSQAGGGSLPTLELPTVLVTLEPQGFSVGKWAANLRQGEPAVLARIAEDKLVLDVRTIFDGELKPLAEALKQSLPESNDQ